MKYPIIISGCLSVLSTMYLMLSPLGAPHTTWSWQGDAMKLILGISLFMFFMFQLVKFLETYEAKKDN